MRNLLKGLYYWQTLIASVTLIVVAMFFAAKLDYSAEGQGYIVLFFASSAGVIAPIACHKLLEGRLSVFDGQSSFLDIVVHITSQMAWTLSTSVVLTDLFTGNLTIMSVLSVAGATIILPCTLYVTREKEVVPS